MVAQCQVVGCTYRGTSGFCLFPVKNQALVILWRKRCGLPDNHVLKAHYRVCRSHFKPESFSSKGYLLKVKKNQSYN